MVSHSGLEAAVQGQGCGERAEPKARRAGGGKQAGEP